MAKDNKQIAQNVLEAVGGKENVSFVNHCMTRLRFNLRDESIPQDDALKSIDGVLGVVHAGGQLQVIIGQNVTQVYDEICRLGSFVAQKSVEENLDAPKKKRSAKQIGSDVLNYMSNSMMPCIPALVGAALFKTLITILGPDMLGLFSAESNTYILLDFVYDAGFYFLPIYIGYSAAVKLNMSPVMGMLMGGILLSPDFIALANAGAEFAIFGIPCRTVNYAQSVLPILLCVWIMSYVDRFFRKVVPEAVTTIFTPFLTILVMLPVGLCILAPAGSYLGDALCNALVAFGNVGGFVAVAILGAVIEFLIMTGMHLVLGIAMITAIMTSGSESVIGPAIACGTCAVMGMAFGAFLRIRDKDEKSLALSYFISDFVGGVSEPVLYGIGLKYKKPFLGMMIGGGLGGLYAGITHVAMHTPGATNFLVILGFAPGGASNLVNGVIACVIAFVAATIATFIIGFGKSSTTVKKV